MLSWNNPAYCPVARLTSDVNSTHLWDEVEHMPMYDRYVTVVYLTWVKHGTNLGKTRKKYGTNVVKIDLATYGGLIVDNRFTLWDLEKGSK